MIIEIVNKLNGRTAQFCDLPAWQRLNYAGWSLLPQNYGKFVNDKRLEEEVQRYILVNYSGFYDNNKIVSWTRNGIAVNGQVFKTNNFENKTIQWNFLNATYGNLKDGSSANFLNSVLMSKNTPLTVNVYTSQNKFTQDFYPSEETSTENGTIQMVSAYDGDGIYWHDTEPVTKTATKYVNDNADDKPNAYIIKKLKYIPLHKKQESIVKPNQLRLVVDTVNDATVIKIKVGNQATTIRGKINILNTLTGEKMEINPQANDKYFIIDPIAKTVVNDKGEDRIQQTNKVFPWLQSGKNEFIITYEGYQDIDNEKIFSIEYYNNYTAIF